MIVLMNYKLYAIAILLAVANKSVDSFSVRAPLLTTRTVTRNNPRPSISIFTLQAGQLAPGEDQITPSIDEKDDEDDDDEVDEVVDSLTEKLDEMEGLWYSDDFYGPHGREWVKVSAALVGESATSALVAVKVTGDPNVPAGCVTFRTKSWPGLGSKVAAEIQVRADPKDPDGFSWLAGELTLVAKNEIRLMVRYNFLMSGEGTFYKQNNENECDDN